jgi:hypothetical protein
VSWKQTTSRVVGFICLTILVLAFLHALPWQH